MSRNFRRMGWTASVLAAAAFSGCAQRHGKLAGDPFLDSASPGGRIADMPSTATPRAGGRDERTAARHETINRAEFDDAGASPRKNDGRSLASRASAGGRDVDRDAARDGAEETASKTTATSKTTFAARPTRDPLLTLGGDRKSGTSARPSAKPLSQTALAAAKEAPDFEPDDEPDPLLAKRETKATRPAKSADDVTPESQQKADESLAAASETSSLSPSKAEADPFPDDAGGRPSARSTRPSHPLETAANEGDASDAETAQTESAGDKPQRPAAVAARTAEVNPFEDLDADQPDVKRPAATKPDAASRVAKSTDADDPFRAVETWSRPTTATPREESAESGPIEPVVAESDAGASSEPKRPAPTARRPAATLEGNPFADLDDEPNETAPTTARAAKPDAKSGAEKRFDAWDLSADEPVKKGTDEAVSEPRSAARPQTRVVAKPAAIEWDDEEPEEPVLRPLPRTARATTGSTTPAPRRQPAPEARTAEMPPEVEEDEAVDSPAEDVMDEPEEPTGHVRLRNRGIAPMSYQFEARPPRKATPTAPTSDKTPAKGTGWKPRATTTTSDNAPKSEASQPSSPSPASDLNKP